MADPVVDFTATDIEFEESSFDFVDFGTFTLSDADGDVNKVVLSVSDGSLIANDGDGLQPSGVTIQTDDSQNITIFGSASAIEGYLGLMGVFSFDATFLSAGNDVATLTITAYDDTAGVVSDTINIDITAAGGGNTDPYGQFLPSDVTAVVDTASDVDFGSFSVGDNEDDALTITLTASGGTLAASSGGGVTVGNSGTSAITLSGSVADINTFLGTSSNVQYTSASGVHGIGADTISVTANDGTSGDIALGSFDVNISSPDDPTQSGSVPASINATEQAASDLDLSGLDFGDPNGDTITVTLSVEHGVLNATSGGSVTVGGDGTATLTLTGLSADINTFLDTTSNVSYTSDNGINGNGADSLVIKVADAASGDWEVGSVSLDIASDNADPTVSGLPGSDLSASASTNTDVDLSGVTVADTDSATVTVTLTASAGTLSNMASLGWSVTSSNPDAQTIVLTGAPADITSFLNVVGNVSFYDDTEEVATITVTVEDIDGSGVISAGTFNINVGAAVDTPPDVTGDFTGSVTEGNIGDAAVTASGSLSITDADPGDDPSFDDMTSTAGDNGYGHFTLVSGTWTYTLDQSAVQDLDDGEQVTDSLTFVATDGTMQDITVTITGSDDAAVVGGTFTGTVTEGNVGDAAVTATGTLTISDVDGDDTPSFADVSSTEGDNGYGSFTLVNGDWTYTLDQSKVQDLDAGDQVTDSLTFVATDGTMQDVTVTINGANDNVVVTGNTNGSVTEGNIGDNPVTASGTLAIDDLDADDDPVFQNVTNAKGTYGTFNMSNGSWTYTLDQTKVQQLAKDQQVTDTYTFTGTDGTTQPVVITIKGTDDAAVVTGTFGGTITEGNIGDPVSSVSGTIAISDLDGTPSFANVSSAAGTYGSFKLQNGTWTYTLDQSKVQDLNDGDTRTDTHTFVATDGTAQLVSVSIKGQTDTPIVVTPPVTTPGGTVTPPNVTVSGTVDITSSLNQFSGGTSGSSSTPIPTVTVTTGAGSNVTGDVGGFFGSGTDTLSQTLVVSAGSGSTTNLTTGTTSGGGFSNGVGGGFGGGLGDGLGGGLGSHQTSVAIQSAATGVLTGTSSIDNNIFGNTVVLSTLEGHNQITLSGNTNALVLGGSGGDDVIVGAGNDYVFGGGGDDTIVASGGHDFILGGAGDDSIIGGTGDSRYSGGAGDDIIISGGSSNDTIVGGDGNNTISGGDGEDTFRFSGAAGDDIVADYDAGDDTLDLRALGITSVEDLISKVVDFNIDADRGIGSIKFESDSGRTVTLINTDHGFDQFKPEDFHDWHFKFADSIG